MKLICLLLGLFICISASSENVLLNPGFETINHENPNLPYAWGYFPRNEFGKVCSDTAVDGRNSVMFNVPLGKEAPCGFHQSRNIEIPADTPIKLSTWYKNSQLAYPKDKSPTWGIAMTLRQADGKKAYPALKISRAENWSYTEKIFNFPSAITAIQYIYLQDYNTSGKIWYDDIYFGPWSEMDILENAAPYVSIPAVGTAPVLDGKLDDACWRKAARLDDFILCGKDQFAQNKTEVYLARNADNLYIGVKSFAEVLNPELQMLDKFIAKETEHDGSVFRDDSLEIFIAPDSKVYYQLACNSLGTRYDGKTTEKSWNCEWTVKTSVNNRSWDAEIIIPLKQLGINPDGQSTFRFNICRNEPAARESSSWAPLTAGYHDISRFGTAAFGPTTVQTVPSTLSAGIIDLGTRKFKFESSNANNKPEQIRAGLQVFRDDSGTMQAEVIALPSGKSAQCELSTDFKDAGSYKYRYLTTSLTSGKLLYRSPLYTITSRAIMPAVNKISFPGKVQLSLNGRPVSGKTFFLQNGANVITAEFTGNGAVSGGIELADSARSLPETISFNGECKDKLTLTKTILVNSTGIYPVDTANGLHLEKGASQHLPFVIAEPNGKTLEIMMPTTVKAVDYQPNKTCGYAGVKHESTPAADRKINGTDYKLYDFKFSSPEKTKKFVLGFVAALPENTADQIAPIYFRTVSDKSTEAWQKVPVVVMPSLCGKRPSKLKLELWHGYGVGGYSPEQVAALVKTFARSGFNAFGERVLCYGSDIWLKPLKANNMSVASELHQIYQLAQIFKQYPESRAKNFDGKTPRFQRLKLNYIYGAGREKVTEIISSYTAKYKPEAIVIDLEAPPFRECDTSPETLQEFAKFAKLSKVPSPAEIKQQYQDQWIDFVCMQWAKAGQVYKEAAQKGNPGTEFGVYSAYQNPHYKKHYAIDWKHWRGIADFAEMGYGRQPEAIRQKTMEALGTTPSYTGIVYWQQNTPDVGKTLKNKVLRRITDGAKGIMLYTWVRLDGIARTKISEAAAILADYEEFFLKNKHSNAFKTSGGITANDVVLLENNGKYLLLVFNDHKAVKTGKVTVNGKEITVRVNSNDITISPI